MEEITIFLEDIKDGRYDGKPILPVETQTLESQTLRESLALDKKSTGVLVRKIHRSEPSYPLKIDDVLVKMGDHSIDNLGMVKLDGDRPIGFLYLVQRLVRDGRLPVSVLRHGKEMKFDVPVDSDFRRLFRDLMEEPLSYFMYGPLVFTEASEEYVRSMTSYVEHRVGRGTTEHDLQRNSELYPVR